MSRDAENQTRRRQRFLWAGLVLLLAVLLAFFHLGFFLYAVLVVLGLGLVSWWIAATGITGVTVERDLSQVRVEPGGRIEVRLTVKNGKSLPIPWLYWEEQLEAGVTPEGPSCGLATFGGGEIRDLVYRLELPRRGLYRVGPALIESSDPFGLVRRFHVGQDAAFVTVLPRVIPMGDAWPLGHRPVHQVPRRRSLFEDPTRFVGVRDYQPTDSRWRVHWRASARTGRLQSRVYEPTVLAGLLLAVDLNPASYAAAVAAGGTSGGAHETPGGPENGPADVARTARSMGPARSVAGGPMELAGSLAGGPDGLGGESDPETLARWEAGQLMELAITAAASLADFVLGGGQAVGLFSNGADAAERYPSEWSGATFRRLEGALAQTATRRIIRRRPVEVESGKGQWQREILRTALARLVPSDGIPLPALLTGELPRLPRSLVLTVITPALDRELAAALGMLKRSGFEVSVVWLTGAAGAGAGAVGLPEGIPVYRVRDENDLARLGVCRL